MKHVAFLLGLFCATAVAADPVAGTWQTGKGESGAYLHVKIVPCGSLICGTVAKVLGGGDTSIVGKRLIWDMAAQGGGSYGGGRVWAPDTDKVYRSKMSLNGNSLKVSGCVGPICRGQTWKRVN